MRSVRSISWLSLVLAACLLLATAVTATPTCSCPAGSFCDSSNGNACSPCAPGKFQSSSQQRSCNTCPENYYSTGGATTCTACPAGTKSGSGSTSADQCVPCPAGQYSTGGGSGCQYCQDGYISPAGASQCTICPANTYDVSHRGVTCAPCGSGKGSAPGSSTCTSLSSRGMATRRELAEANPSLFCPTGWTSCPLPQRVGATGQQKVHAFECVNTDSDVEACGGCTGDLTSTGEDCTLFDPLATASCVSGKCQYACPRGYNLTDTGCTREKARLTFMRLSHLDSTL